MKDKVSFYNDGVCQGCGAQDAELTEPGQLLCHRCRHMLERIMAPRPEDQQATALTQHTEQAHP